MTTNTTNIREVVLDVLLEVLENHNLSHLVLKQALEKYLFLERQDRAFITRCVEGTLEYRIQIDAVIDRFSKVKTAKMKPVIREILRMSVYQILYMERVPDSAVCNEAVKLAKKRKFQGLSGFVNGAEDRLKRKRKSVLEGCIHPVFDPAVDAVHVGGDVWKRDRGDDRGIVPGGTSAHGAV